MLFFSKVKKLYVSKCFRAPLNFGLLDVALKPLFNSYIPYSYILCEKLTQGLMMHLDDNQLDMDFSFINMSLKSNINEREF